MGNSYDDETKRIPQATLTESSQPKSRVVKSKQERSGIVESRDFGDHEPLRKVKTKIHAV